MDNLDTIFNKHNTDKGSMHFERHNYSGYYESYLSKIRDAKINLLEIGVNDQRCPGASLKAWSEYFPNATIYGLDITECSHLGTERVNIFIGNQSSRTDLSRLIEKFKVEFDIIIDDGSHSPKDQQISMGFLFKFLKSGGVYVIEDLHVSRETIDFLDSLESPYLEDSEKTNLKETLLSKEIFNDKISFCVKK